MNQGGTGTIPPESNFSRLIVKVLKEVGIYIYIYIYIYIIYIYIYIYIIIIPERTIALLFIMFKQCNRDIPVGSVRAVPLQYFPGSHGKQAVSLDSPARDGLYVPMGQASSNAVPATQ